jgi:hypothetical protein
MASSVNDVDLYSLDAMDVDQKIIADTQSKRKIDPKYPATTHTAKKRRMSHKTFEKEEVQSEGNSHGEGGTLSELAVAVKEEEDDGCSVADDKLCVGCQRSPKTSTCWCDSSQAMQWAIAAMRGAWCRECHCLWRLAFQDRSSLAMMSAHILSGSLLADEWSVSILAWATIRRSQLIGDRVTRAALTERVDIVRFLYSALGQPIGQSFCVRPLSSLDDLPSASTYINYVDTTGEFRVGVLAPCSMVGCTAPTTARPTDGTWFGTGRQTLICTNVEDKVWFENLQQTRAEMPTASCEQRGCKREPNPPQQLCMSKEGKKCNAKLRGQVASALLVLQAFEGDEWQEFKETSFTHIMSKLQATKLEAADEQLETLINEAESWCAGLGHCILFAKRYRECLRSKTTVRKWGPLDDATDKVYKFIRMHVKVGHSFFLLRLKANVQCQPVAISTSGSTHAPKGDDSQPRSLNQRVTDLIAMGLCDVLRSMLDGDKKYIERAQSWLRSTIFGELAADIGGMCAEHINDYRVSLARDLSDVIATLQNYCKKQDEFIFEIVAFQTDLIFPV